MWPWRCRTAYVQIDKQEDPVALRREKREEYKRRGLFRDLCEDWYRAEVLDRDMKHPGTPRRYIDNHLVPVLGSKPAVEITVADLARLLDGIKKRAPAAANDLLRFTRRIFAFGVRRRMVPSNPTADLSPRLDAGGTERARNRALNLDELARLFEAIRKTPSFGGENLLGVRLLLALCVRKGELFGSRWSEFDLIGRSDRRPVWHLPADRTKTNEALDIPLVPTVVSWLRTLHTLADRSEWAFPRRKHDKHQRAPQVSFDTLNVAMARVHHDLMHFTIHDLRRTARTHLAALGVRREVAERCLGHKLGGVEGTYDRHDYYKERRAALGQWTALLIQAEAGTTQVTTIGALRSANSSANVGRKAQ